MSLTVYNYLTRRKEEFIPLQPGRIHLYVCGPTVYDNAHIGHAKTYVHFDVIVRFLRYCGYRVRYVQNITDVGHILDTGEDRILKGAARERVEPMELVERYTREYFADMDALGVVRPDISPRASAHIPEQIEMIKALLAAGHAYEVNGSVYFDVNSFPEYGKLSGRRLEELAEGARVAVREEKRHPADFALWKRAEPEHILRWPSPWGWGYPGWHIECSAMATKYLGTTFDIHGGGVDNIFPHNECEIAQAEAATRQPFARHWLLSGSLTVNGVKMSKSLGNFTTIREVLKRYPPAAVRLFILSGHYRSPIDFSDDALQAAYSGWERLSITAQAVHHRLRAGNLATGTTASFRAALEALKDKFIEAMNDDFNAPAAIAILFELSKLINSALSATPTPTRDDLEAAQQLYMELGFEVLGVLAASPTEVSSERVAGLIDLVLELRTAARQRKDFAQADAIRQRLQELGIILADGKDGTSWRFS